MTDYQLSTSLPAKAQEMLSTEIKKSKETLNASTITKYIKYAKL